MSTTKRDYYEVLGVPRDAGESEIRSAYRKLARRHHPDVSDDPDAHRRFQEIGEAYAVLSDAEKRAGYDRFGHQGVTGPTGDPGFGDLFDLFRTVVGGFGYEDQPVSVRGGDVNYEFPLTLEDVATGVETEIAVSRHMTCDECDGDGTGPNGISQQCPTCRGRGRVRYQQQAMFMTISQEAECPDCNATGTHITEPCEECRGSGRRRRTEKVSVEIPQGVEHGQRIQYRAAGDAGPLGTPPGDLFVHVRVQPHDRFVRRGNDLAVELPIDFTQAALGDVIEIPGLLEPHELHIAAGAQHGSTIRIRGGGLPQLRRPERVGDLHVVMRVDVPKKLNKTQRELLLKLADASGIEITPPTSAFRRKIDEVLGG